MNAPAPTARLHLPKHFRYYLEDSGVISQPYLDSSAGAVACRTIFETTDPRGYATVTPETLAGLDVIEEYAGNFTMGGFDSTPQERRDARKVLENIKRTREELALASLPPQVINVDIVERGRALVTGRSATHGFSGYIGIDGRRLYGELSDADRVDDPERAGLVRGKTYEEVARKLARLAQWDGPVDIRIDEDPA